MPLELGTFADIAAAAVADFAENGYDSEQRLEVWMAALREAAERDLMPEVEVVAQLRQTLESIYARLVDRGGLLQYTPGIERFTLERVKPELRSELSRRIMASANLIKLNRERMIGETLQRFAGWASSVPAGGDENARRREVQTAIKKPLYSLPFTERRVHIDQGHKMLTALSDVLARDGGAIAAKWRQHYTRYPREVHKQRNGDVYLIRDSWANEAGFVSKANRPYVEEIEQPGFLIFCRCTYRYLFALRQLPPDMLTKRGKDELDRVRQEAAA